MKIYFWYPVATSSCAGLIETDSEVHSKALVRCSSEEKGIYWLFVQYPLSV